MSLREETAYLLKHYSLKADTSRGQHWLVDDEVLADIVSVCDPTRDSWVVEIGCGLGTLTKAMLEKNVQLIGFENDERLAPLLKKLAEVQTDFHLYMKDFLKVAPAEWLSQIDGPKYRVAANIPYYITGSIIEHLMTLPRLPERIVLLMQREVAENIVAEKGNYSKQSLAVHFHGRPMISFIVPATAFWPAPEVQSAILVIDQIHPWEYDVPESEVWRLVTIGFSSRRKKLSNNLAAGLHLEKTAADQLLVKAGIDPEVRAERLTPDQWTQLARSWK